MAFIELKVGHYVRIKGSPEVYQIIKVDEINNRYELKAKIGTREISGRYLVYAPENLRGPKK